jgi:sporulation protein YlmC with PRC-barrel domain
MSTNLNNPTSGKTATSHHGGALSATTLIGDPVVNPKGEKLGKIEDLVIDPQSSRVDYAVLSFGGFLGMGDKLFAVPLEAMRLSSDERKFILNVDKERLKDAPGFDKDNWPETSDRAFGTKVYSYYSCTYVPRPS